MGLYYQAIVSSLLLNFLPDLPTTSFFTPQSPILFFFSLWLLLFSLCFFHITADCQQVKRKLTSLPLSGRLTFYFSFFAQKVPIFCEDCHPELTEAYHNPKDGRPRHRAPKEELPKNGNPWTPLRELWQLFPTHYGAWHAHNSLNLTSQTHTPSTLSTQITTNTLIHSPSTCHCITHPALLVCVFVACSWQWCVCLCVCVGSPWSTLTPGPIFRTFLRISKLIKDYRFVQWHWECRHDTWA